MVTPLVTRSSDLPTAVFAAVEVRDGRVVEVLVPPGITNETIDALVACVEAEYRT
jgi:hypothetical protein